MRRVEKDVAARQRSKGDIDLFYVEQCVADVTHPAQNV